jgi:HEAT repeat protein
LWAGDVEQATIAIERLCEDGGPAAIRVLENALAIEDPVARGLVIDALGEIGDQHAVPALIALLGDPDTREEVAEALGRLKDPRAVGPLLRVLERSDEPLLVQAAAARALGRIGDSGAWVALNEIALDSDRDRGVRAAATDAAAAVDPRAKAGGGWRLHLLWISGAALTALALVFASDLRLFALVPLIVGVTLAVIYRAKAAPGMYDRVPPEWEWGDGGGDGGGGN